MTKRRHGGCTIEQIYKYNNRILEYKKSLPSLAVLKYAQQSIFDEIMLTNDIEGVYSSRSEIIVAFKSPDKTKRFSGIMDMYMKLLSEEKVEIKTCEDIRNLYDEIVLSEIDEPNRPDGQLFRLNSTSVYSPTDKEIHRGLLGEKNIISHIQLLLEFLNNSSVPDLIKIPVFHYYFGYIHPFYDGNGRLNRFISSYLLSGFLNNLISFKISYEIKNSLSKYYSAFNVCNDPKNRGDLTPFVEMFLEVIKNAALSTISQLKDYSLKLSHYFNCLESISNKLLDQLNKEILFLIVQNDLFDSNPLTLKEISQILEKSEHILRPRLEFLIENQFITKQKHSRSFVYPAQFDVLDKIYETTTTSNSL